MLPRVNQGRTYNGGNPSSTSTGPRRNVDSNRPTHTQGQGAAGDHNVVQESRGGSFLSRSDMGSRTADDKSTLTSTSTGANLTSSMQSQSQSASRPRSSMAARPVTSEDTQQQHLNGNASDSRVSAPVNNADQRTQNAGQVKGILKARAPAGNAATELNTSQNKTHGLKSSESTAVANPLQGQFTFIGGPEGMREPIKTLQKTLADLRAGKSASEAFQSKEASYLYAKKANGCFTAVKDIPYLSVYFPLSERKETQHNPSECGRVCNGALHVDRAPTCRFCLARIAPRYKDVITFDMRVARECLNHLQSCPGIPNEEDRKLLYNAFRKADERFIADYHTSQWKTNIVTNPEIHHPRPTLPPKPRSQPQFSSVPMQKKTSGTRAAPPSAPAPATFRPRQESRQQQAYVPIAAKQVPNNAPPPTEPAAMRRARVAAELESSTSSSHRPSASTSTLPPPDEEAGWGVLANSAAYHEQLTVPTPSEQDELEEPQWDPEDNFTWQAVKDHLLKTVPADNVRPAATAPQPTNNDTAMSFGAELIPTPQLAPQGPAYVPLRQFSVPPSRPVSRNAYLNANEAAPALPEVSQQEEMEELGSGSGSAPMGMSSTTSSSASESRQRKDNLFRPATPPSSRNAKQELPTPTLSLPRKREPSAETQDIPEPELPAEDPWDLVPEPGFETFFNRTTDRDFVRSGAPSCESLMNSKSSSASPEPELESPPVGNVPSTVAGKPSGNKTSRRETSFVVEVPTPRREASATSQSTAQTASVQTEKKQKKTPAEKEAKKIRKAEKQKDEKRRAQEEAETVKIARERSPSVECLNPIRPVPKASSSASEAHINNDDAENAAPPAGSSKDSLFSAAENDDDDDGDLPLRAMPSTQTIPQVQVLEISSDEDEAPQLQSAPSQRKAKPSIGPVAQKTFRKKRASSAQPSDDDDDDDNSSSSDSDSDAPKVTSKKVDYVPRPGSAASSNSVAQTRGRPSTASSKPQRQKAPIARTRLPTPSDPSDSESEPESRPPTASQVAAAARRFQRFAERDNSPVHSTSKSRKKRKLSKAKSFDRDASPSRIVRRRVDVHEESPASIESRKRKAKVIESSDEEEDENDQSQSKRLKSYAERQNELAGRASGSTSRRSSLGTIEPVDATAYFDHKPDLFFVDLQKNVDNVLSLPKELKPWQDIFQAADILNLDSLRDCIGSADNADESVKWVVERTGRQVSLAKQFPMVQALRHVLSHE